MDYLAFPQCTFSVITCVIGFRERNGQKKILLTIHSDDEQEFPMMWCDIRFDFSFLSVMSNLMKVAFHLFDGKYVNSIIFYVKRKIE